MSTDNERASLQQLLSKDPASLPEDPGALMSMIEGDGAPGEPGGDGDFLDGEQDPAKAVDDAAAKAKAEEDAKAQADAEAKAQAEAKAAEEAKAKAEADAAKAVEDGKANVLSKDGLHTLPYGVLEGARRKAAEEAAARAKAEQEASEAREQASRLTAELEALKNKGADGGKTASEGEIADLKSKVNELTEALPEEFKPVFEGILGALDGMSAKFAALERDREVEVQARQKSAAETVQEAIDANETLRYLQAEKPELFAEAVEIDRRLMESPLTKGLPLAERFERAVKGVVSVFGEIEIPEAYRLKKDPPQGDPAKKVETPAPKKDEKKGASVEDRPFTMSDLPGGAAPQGEGLNLEEMSVADAFALIDGLAERGKRPDEIAAALLSRR